MRRETLRGGTGRGSPWMVSQGLPPPKPTHPPPHVPKGRGDDGGSPLGLPWASPGPTLVLKGSCSGCQGNLPGELGIDGRADTRHRALQIKSNLAIPPATTAPACTAAALNKGPARPQLGLGVLHPICREPGAHPIALSCVMLPPHPSLSRLHACLVSRPFLAPSAHPTPPPSFLPPFFP